MHSEDKKKDRGPGILEISEAGFQNSYPVSYVEDIIKLADKYNLHYLEVQGIRVYPSPKSVPRNDVIQKITNPQPMDIREEESMLLFGVPGLGNKNG